MLIWLERKKLKATTENWKLKTSIWGGIYTR